MATEENSSQNLDSHHEDNENIKCNLLQQNGSDLQNFSVEVNNTSAEHVELTLLHDSKLGNFNKTELCAVPDNDISTDPYFESKESTVINEIKLKDDNKSCNESTLQGELIENESFPTTVSETIIEASNYDPEDTTNKPVSLENSKFLGVTNSSDCFHTHRFSNNTSDKDISKINLFKKGVTCTSTPLHGHNMKNKFENLSIIKEEEEESKDSKVAVIDNVNQITLFSNSAKDCREDVLDRSTSESIVNLSVLRKDELSLLIDLPNEIILKEERKFDIYNQSLSLPVNANESVIYKNIVDKTIDELLLEDDKLISIKDLNHIENESDRKEILIKATALRDFISSNDEENQDNNDPEWELLKKLETDDERYKAVRKIWRNLAIPDLKQNLSTFNWRKKNSLPALKNIVPINTNQIGEKRKKLTYNCTEVFDLGIKNLHDFYNRQRLCMQPDDDNDKSMASLSKKPRLEMGYEHVARSKQSDLAKLLACVQERLKRHDEAKEEIQAVHGFYNGLKNQGNGGYGNMMLISHEERQGILDIENMINQYTSWYP